MLSACAENETDESSAGDSTATTAATSSAIPFDPGGIAQDSVPIRTPEGTPARYGWKSGHVVLRYTGGLLGQREIYFDDWGMRERRLDSTEPAPGVPGPKQYTLLISDADRFTMLDLPQKSGWSMENDSDERYLESDSSKDISLAEMIFRTSGGVRRADEMVNGVKANVLEMDQGGSVTKIWVRQGLVIKEQFTPKGGTGFAVEPVLIEFDVDVPKSLFDIPPGMKIQERPKGNPFPGTGQAPGAAPPGQAPQGTPPSGSGMPGGGTMPMKPTPGGSAMPIPMPPPGGR
ncbi:MAG: hypothetical protein H7X80_02120 [bacterium]|nr:hypothetical protein [Candidatus Kapabacteria bacterium]